MEDMEEGTEDTPFPAPPSPPVSPGSPPAPSWHGGDATPGSVTTQPSLELLDVKKSSDAPTGGAGQVFSALSRLPASNGVVLLCSPGDHVSLAFIQNNVVVRLITRVDEDSLALALERHLSILPHLDRQSVLPSLDSQSTLVLAKYLLAEAGVTIADVRYFVLFGVNYRGQAHDVLLKESTVSRRNCPVLWEARARGTGVRRWTPTLPLPS